VLGSQLGAHLSTWSSSSGRRAGVLVVGLAGIAVILSTVATLVDPQTAEHIPWVGAAVGGVVGLIASVHTVRAAARDAKAATDVLQQAPPSLAERIDQLRVILAESSALINEINAEIQLQTTALDRIRAEAEDNRRLASLHQKEADAVRGQGQVVLGLDARGVGQTAVGQGCVPGDQLASGVRDTMV
jgi:hypothetical protein